MVVEETVFEIKEQWRVPPIKNNHTVDIFTEPEYFQVMIRPSGSGCRKSGCRKRS